MANITNNSDACQRLNTYTEGNRTLISGYEGIPHNLLINAVSCVVMLSLFFVVRKVAWRYSQAALLGSSETSWSHFFHPNRLSDATDSEQHLDSGSSQSDNSSLTACLSTYFRLTDSDIARVAGDDAVCYLRLQRYLLAYLLIVAVPALAVVLPVNIHGGYADSVGEFSSTTINNLSGDSSLLWLHASLSGAYMLLAAACMLLYGRRVAASDAHAASDSCLLVLGLPTEALDTDTVARHFREAYPTATVEEVDLAYDIRKLQELHDEHAMAQSVLQLCREQQQQQQQRQQQAGSGSQEPTVTLRGCTWPCGGCCCGTRPAVEFYAEREAAVAEQLAAEAELAKKRRLPIAFVQFASSADAGAVLRDFRRSGGVCGRLRRLRPSASSLDSVVRPADWTVRTAPHPEDVNWCNLPHAASCLWYLRAVAVNSALFLLLFFFTTPLYIVNLFKAHNPALPLHLSVLSDFLPTLFMWIFSAALPFAVYYSDTLVKHWTKSDEHYSVMFKCSMYQILMILILPSFGLVRADALLQWVFTMNERDSERFRQRWECVFVSENASFFVNYIITSACIGCCVELLRLPEMLRYGISWLSARSQAEARLVFKKTVSEFEYGFNFSWLLCIFAIVMTYASSPLILLCGILYMLAKMLVDRYNIYYAYRPSVMDRSVHELSQSIVLTCALLGEVFVAGFFLFRIPNLSDGRTICILLLVAVSACCLVARAAFLLMSDSACCSELRGTQRQQQQQQQQRRQRQYQRQSSYTPSVLLHSMEAAPVQQDTGQ